MKVAKKNDILNGGKRKSGTRLAMRLELEIKALKSFIKL